MESSFLAWVDEYSVGNEGLDAQHRQLVAVINEIYSAECANQTQHQLRDLLNTFELAAVEHFKHENSVMRAISDGANWFQPAQSAVLMALIDAGINEHYADHARALIKLDAIVRAFHSGADAAKQALSSRLSDWFVEHAITSDLHLKEYFGARS
jgi:hemerythrin